MITEVSLLQGLEQERSRSLSEAQREITGLKDRATEAENQRAASLLMQATLQQEVDSLHMQHQQSLRDSELNTQALKAKMRHAQVEWNTWYQTAVSVEKSLLVQVDGLKQQLEHGEYVWGRCFLSAAWNNLALTNL